MRKNLFLLFVSVLFSVEGEGRAQGKAQKIDELLTRYYDCGQFNGSVLVAEKGEVIYRKGFGFADFEWKIPNAPDTKFRIGSITKSFTAALVLQLIERGKLKLEDGVTAYLPDFPKAKFGKITIHHLLAHSSGLPDYNNIPDFFRAVQSGLLSGPEILRRISEHELLFEPGTQFGYSNDGYRLLGAIIEKITGKAYPEVLRENILDPLEMTNTGYVSRTALLEKRACGYRKTLSGLENAPYYAESPASGMYSTVENLFFWNQALNSDKLLSQKSKDLMWSVVPSGNAYGWHVSKRMLEPGGESTLVVMSEGAVFGYFARTLRLPKDGHFIALLTNVRAATNYLPDIGQAIVNILYGQPHQAPKKSIAETLLSTIKQRGIGAAVEQYRTLKKERADSYSFSESELNNLGYLLLNDMGKIDDAIEIFTLNVEAYPQSSNAYDSLGEAYMKNGDKELAIKNYRRSLELNPQNTNATEMLKKLLN